MPRPGETALATSASRGPGGKGLNQAVASARAGADTRFLGSLGSDPFGDELASELVDAGIGCDGVRRTSGDTGQAVILVDGSGENLIVVASGANAEFTALADADRAVIATARVLLMQLELPVPLVAQAARAGREAGALVILNAAPAALLPDELFASLDVLVVNEHEAVVLSGRDDVHEAALALAQRVPTLIVTLGADGSSIYREGALTASVPAVPVVAVDTTGAGDTYCGALGAALAEGRTMVEAVRYATSAAALSVQERGAVRSIPSRRDIDRLMKEQS